MRVKKYFTVCCGREKGGRRAKEGIRAGTLRHWRMAAVLVSGSYLVICPNCNAGISFHGVVQNIIPSPTLCHKRDQEVHQARQVYKQQNPFHNDERADIDELD